MKNIIATLLLVICILPLNAQAGTDMHADPVKRYFALRTGVYSMASIDRLYSPFIYCGQAAVLGLNFGREKAERSYETQLHFTNINRPALSLNEISLSYPPEHYQVMKNSFLFEVLDYFRYHIRHSMDEYFQLYFSGLLFTTVNITTNAMGMPELIQFGLAPGLMIRKYHEKHTFKAEINTPLLTWTVRNNYSMSMPQTFENNMILLFIAQNMMFQTPVSNLAVFADLSYAFRINDSFALRGNYHFRYLNNNKPLDLKSVSGIYALTIIYNR